MTPDPSASHPQPAHIVQVCPADNGRTLLLVGVEEADQRLHCATVVESDDDVMVAARREEQAPP